MEESTSMEVGTTAPKTPKISLKEINSLAQALRTDIKSVAQHGPNDDKQSRCRKGCSKHCKNFASEELIAVH